MGRDRQLTPSRLVLSLYGALLMALALYKAAEYWRVSAGFKGFTLVKVLIEDQIIYFTLYVFPLLTNLSADIVSSVIACSVLAILHFKLVLSNTFLADVLSQLGNPSLLSLLGSRMLFNLKEAGERGQNEGTSHRTPRSTMSEMDFVEPANPQRYCSCSFSRRKMSEYSFI